VRNKSQFLAGEFASYDHVPMTEPSATPLDIPEHLFTAIDHVGVAVRDLDEAIAFYRDTLGMQVLHEETNEEQRVREAMVGVGNSGSCIQLLAPLDEQSTSAASAPCTTHRGAARPGRGSTSCTPRTAVASWSSWWSRTPTLRTERVGGYDVGHSHLPSGSYPPVDSA
jgi:catechol 2,3-dioxygenase-like lactoylglutathione lyase family enzyme